MSYINQIDIPIKSFYSFSCEDEFQCTPSAEILTAAVQSSPAEQVTFVFLYSQWGEMGTVQVHATFWETKNISTVDTDTKFS